MIEKDDAQLSDVVGHVITSMLHLYLYIYKVVVYPCLYAFVCEMMSRLIAIGIIRSYTMRLGGRIVPAVKHNVIVPNCDVCGGLVFNAQRYLHLNDAYFARSTIRFPYEVKKIFDRILHELQYLDKVHPHHFTLDLDHLDKIFEYRLIQSSSYSFPVTNVELECRFDILGFLSSS